MFQSSFIKQRMISQYRRDISLARSMLYAATGLIGIFLILGIIFNASRLSIFQLLSNASVGFFIWIFLFLTFLGLTINSYKQPQISFLIAAILGGILLLISVISFSIITMLIWIFFTRTLVKGYSSQKALNATNVHSEHGREDILDDGFLND